MKVLIDMPDSFIKEHIENYEQGSLVDIAVRNALKHGIVLDGLTNGEVIQKIFKVSDTSEGMATMFAYTRDDDMLTADMGWWNRKWGE